MSYPIILSRRMPYDIDGTAVGRRGATSGLVTHWLTPAQLFNMNMHDTDNSVDPGTRYLSIYFFFPELREIEALHISGVTRYNHTFLLHSIYASVNSGNGHDGDWEQGIYNASDIIQHNPIDLSWRIKVGAISFSGPKKVLRITLDTSGGTAARAPIVKKIHIYGAKAATETPDDILIMQDSAQEFVALKDWGTRPEGTLQKSSFRLKNSSNNKTAQNINVQLNNADFLLSWSEGGPWSTFVDIASLNPGVVSSPIYIKNELGPPLLALGPKAARVIVGVDSWS